MNDFGKAFAKNCVSIILNFGIALCSLSETYIHAKKCEIFTTTHLLMIASQLCRIIKLHHGVWSSCHWKYKKIIINQNQIFIINHQMKIAFNHAKLLHDTFLSEVVVDKLLIFSTKHLLTFELKYHVTLWRSSETPADVCSSRHWNRK